MKRRSFIKGLLGIVATFFLPKGSGASVIVAPKSNSTPEDLEFYSMTWKLDQRRGKPFSDRGISGDDFIDLKEETAWLDDEKV